MSIDISSMIPMINTLDIRIDKEKGSQKIRPVEESSDSENTGLQMDKDGAEEAVMGANNPGVGDTYNVNGDLLKEIRRPRGEDNKKMTIDVMF
jgi:hypothetical protein